ncbi:MAG: hypothetical protein QXX38_01910 [Candidatus Aenigmatarchaeota archaeon]
MAIEKYQEEFELIPISPLRKLEKRIEQIEASSIVDTKEFLKEVLDIIRMNQQLVDQLAKADDALRIEISKLPGRIEDLIGKIDELLSYVKAAATEEITSGISFKPLVEKLDQLIEENKKIVENNQSMLSTLEEIDKKLKRPALPPPRIPPIRPIQK